MAKKIYFGAVLTLALILSMMSFSSAFNWNNGVVTYYNFDDTGSMNNLTDLATARNNGTNFGDVTRGDTGEIGNSYYYDGTDYSIVDTADMKNLSGDFSFNFWMKSTYPIIYNTPIARSKAGGGTGSINFLLDDSGQLKLLAGLEGDPSTLSISGAYDGNWHMITMSYIASNTTLALFKDGSFVASKGDAQANAIDAGFFLSLGQNADGIRQYVGNLDELGIWNRTLSASEVNELYNVGEGLAFSQNLGEAPFTNLSSEMLSPIDNASQSSPINFQSDLIVNGTTLINATLFIYNSSGIVLSDFKVENINITKTESWTENLNLGNYFWNVQVCNSTYCAFDDENETFNVIPTTPLTRNPNLIHGSGAIFDSLDSIGAGFGIFLQTLGIALPFLLIGLGIVGVVTAIGFGIAHIIRVSMNR